MKTNDVTVNSMIKAMRCTRADIVDDFHKVISDVNENGLLAAVWAKRGQIITDELSTYSDIEVLHIPRGGRLWQVDAAFDKRNRTLYVMVNSDNLDKKRKEFSNNGTSTHYVYSLLYNNGVLGGSEQCSLFDDDEWRIHDSEEMLGQYADQVDRVIIVEVTYVHDMAVKACLDLFNKDYDLVELEDISDRLITRPVTTEANALGEGKKKHVTGEPLVSLKKK